MLPNIQTLVPRRLPLIGLMVVLLFMNHPAWSQTTRFADLLERSEEPAGVVFEIMAAADAWPRILPEIREQIEQLRERWPSLEVVLVSHGGEQFSLTSDKSRTHGDLHASLQALVEAEGVPVQVCGAHAGWYGYEPEDYPAFIDVTPSGPAAINDYRALGFEVILIRGR